MLIESADGLELGSAALFLPLPVPPPVAAAPSLSAAAGAAAAVLGGRPRRFTGDDASVPTTGVVF